MRREEPARALPRETPVSAVRMRLIGFVVLALGLMLAPLAAGQQKMATIGFLGATTPAAQRESTSAFVQRLRELAWIEGRNLVIEYRWAEGHAERSAEFVAEFVRLKVDVIVTGGTMNVLAAKKGTSAIPIIFAAAGDPGRKSSGRESGAPGWQHHRLVEPVSRCRRQAS
jgi:ABC-type uncharacterized transport system substrate-binding protein